MNAVRCPEGVNEAEVRKTLLNEFSIEIGAGLGPLAGKIWRVGLMGASSSSFLCTPMSDDMYYEVNAKQTSVMFQTCVKPALTTMFWLSMDDAYLGRDDLWKVRK